MFQLFLRARAHNYFKTRLGSQDFKARSADRDAETDRLRVGSILEAIEGALHAAELEQSGLNRRVEDVLARAAATMGDGTDGYLGRGPDLRPRPRAEESRAAENEPSGWVAELTIRAQGLR